MFAPTPSTPASGPSASSRYNNPAATGSPFSPFNPHPGYTESAQSSSLIDNTDPRRVVAGLENTTPTPQRIVSLDNIYNNNTPTPSTAAQLYPYHDQRYLTLQLQHTPYPPDGTLSLLPGDHTPSASHRSTQHPQLQHAPQLAQQQQQHSPSRTTSDASPSLEPSAPITPRLYRLEYDPDTPHTPSPMPLYPSSTPQSYGGGVSGATFISGLVPIQSSPAHLAYGQPSFAVLDHGLGLKPSSTTIPGSNGSLPGRPPLRPTVSHNNAVYSSSTVAGPGATPVTTSSAGEAPASGPHHPSWARRPGTTAPTTSAERTTREYPSSSFTVACDPDVSRQPSTTTKASGPAVPTVPTPTLVVNPSSTLGPAQMPAHTHAHHSPSPAPAPLVKVEDNNPSAPHTHTQTHTHASSPAQRSYHHAHNNADTAPHQHGQHPSSSSSFIASSAAPNVNGTNTNGAPATPVSAQTTSNNTTTTAGATGVPAAVAPVPVAAGPNGYHTHPHGVNALPPIQHQHPSHQTTPPLGATYGSANDNVSATSDSGYHYNHYTPLGAPGSSVAAAPAPAPAPSSHGLHPQIVHVSSGTQHQHQQHQHQHHPQQQPQASNGWTTYHHAYNQPPPPPPPLAQPSYPTSWPQHQAPPPPHMNSHYQPYQPYGAHGRQEEPILMPGEMPAPRPPISYAALIGEALLTSPPPHQLYVSEISESIKNRYAYYRQNPSKVYNGVRHQTSMCKAFVKIPRPFGDQTGGARKWGIRAGCETWFSPGLYCPPPNASPSSSSSSSRHRSHGSGGGGSSSGGLGKAKSTAQSKRLAIGTSGSPRPSRSSRRGGRGDDDDVTEPFSPTTNTGGPSVGPAFDGTTSRVSVWTPVMPGGGLQPMPPTSQQQQQQQQQQAQPPVVASPPLTSISGADQVYWQKHGSHAGSQGQYAQPWGYGSAGASSAGYAQTSAPAPTWYGSSSMAGSGGGGGSMQMTTAPSAYSHHTHVQAAATAAVTGPSGHATHGSSGGSGSGGGYPTPITQPAGSPDWRSDAGGPRSSAPGAQDQHHYGSYAHGHPHGHGHGHGHHHSEGGRVSYTYQHGHGAHQHSSSMDGSHDGYDDGQYSAHYGGYSPASNGGGGNDGANGPMSPLDRSPERQ